MSSPSPDPYRCPAFWGFTILAAFLLTMGGFVLDDALDDPATMGARYLTAAAVLLSVGMLSLVVAATTLGTRLALVEHAQARSVSAEVTAR